MDKILVIAWLRFKLLRNGLRSSEGVLNLLSTILLSFFWGAASLGLATLFGVMIWRAEHPVDLEFLPFLYFVVFFTCTFCGVILPLLFGAGGVKLEISRLKMFPISLRRLFAISQAACVGSIGHLLYYPTLLVICVTAIIMPGLNALVGFSIVLSLWLFNLAWGHTIALGIEVVMKKRKGKEILVFISVLLLVVVGVGPAVLDGLVGENWTKDVPVFRALANNLIQVGKTLAPALAAEGLGSLRKGELVLAMRHLMWLWAWIGLGLLIGYFLFKRYYVGDRGKMGRATVERRITCREKDEGVLSPESIFRSFLPSEVFAMAAKEWRYYFRSLVGKLNLVLIPIMVTLGMVIFARHLKNPLLGIDADNLAFYGVLLFVTQMVNNLVCNSFAWEGGGIQSYFFSPAPLRKVILGKNLALWGYDAIIFLLVIGTWTVIKGMLGGVTLLTGFIFFAVVVLSFTSIGNFLSIMFPVPKDISARDNSVSQTALLISIASMVVVTAVIGVFLVVPVLLNLSALQPLSLAVLLAIQIGVYVLTLDLAARLMTEKRETVIEALVSRPLGLTGH